MCAQGYGIFCLRCRGPILEPVPWFNRHHEICDECFNQGVQEVLVSNDLERFCAMYACYWPKMIFSDPHIAAHALKTSRQRKGIVS